MKPALSVKNIYKIFGDNPERALDLLEKGHDKDDIFEETGLTVGVRDASFDIQEGEIFVIMGLSGSGKSTMVRMLNRLIKPTAGHILLGDTDIAELPEKALLDVRRRKVSMVFQSFALMPHMNVLDNVAFGRELAGESAPERRERAQNALERVGLGQHAGSYPDELSGGMQQRVGLARALCTDPDVLLMDEAFSALDPLIRTEMQDELLRLQEEDRRTVVFISHDLDEAFRIGDRIAIMEGGAVVQVGTPDEILHNPANDYVRAFFRGVDVCNVFTAGDIARKAQVTIVRKRGEDGTGPRAALKMLQDYERDYGYVLDADHRFLGVVSAQSLKQAADRGGKLQDALLDAPEPVPDDKPVAEIIADVAQAECGVPVVDANGKYRGVISKTTLLETMDRDTEAEPRQTEADQA